MQKILQKSFEKLCYNICLKKSALKILEKRPFKGISRMLG